MAQLYIDTLPKLQREAVIQAILAGVPDVKVAKMAGCSNTCVKDYRNNVLLPLINRPKNDTVWLKEDGDLKRTAQEANLSREVSQVQSLTADMMQRSTRLMNRLEKAKDLDARGWSAVANVGVKTIQLLGQLSGELDAGRKSDGITIQVLLPSAPRSAQLEVPDTAIDITPR